jgi:hypothetical protein
MANDIRGRRAWDVDLSRALIVVMTNDVWGGRAWDVDLG